MIDIHCHILASIDDGPADLEESVRMFKTASEDKIDYIFATPHYTPGDKVTAENIERRFREAGESLKREGLNIQIFKGADIRLSYELIAAAEKKELPTLNNSRYFLLELPEIIPPNLEKFLFSLGVSGYIPVITHPERNYSLLAAPQKLESLRTSGALFQVTAMSITGEFGSQSESFTRLMFRRGFVDFVATDAHDNIRRKPVLSRAYKEVSRMCKKEEVKRIFFENPEAVLADGRIRMPMKNFK